MKNEFSQIRFRSIIVLLFGFLITSPFDTMGKPVTKTEIKKATILRAMDPVRPGETVLLTGDWPMNGEGLSSGVIIEAARLKKDGVALVNQPNIDLKWQRICPLEVSEQSLKFEIPENWSMGVFACRVVSSSLVASFESSQTVLLNAPDPWWLQGDGGASSASQGGWLRIFGKSLNFGQSVQVQLECKGKHIVLNAQGSKDKGGYALSVNLPKDLPSEDYFISVHNGFGGKDDWKNAGQVKIRPVQKWKQDIFDIREFRSKGNAELADWTEAIKSALAKAQTNGGGVVYFPRGRYMVNDELKIPRFVTIKGESEGLVNLYWPPRDKALPSLISGTDDFAVEEISLYTEGIHHDGIAGRNNMRVQRVRIRADAYYRHDFVGVANSVKPVNVSSREFGTGIRITGDNAVVTDCDIYHSAEAIEMYHTHGGLIARNRLDYGKGPIQVYGLSRVIIEDNECSGAALWASGCGISLNYGACASYHIYFAQNKIRQNYGGAREAMTLDGHGTAYLGKVEDVKGSLLTLTKESWWSKDYYKDMIPKVDFHRGIERKKPERSPLLQEEWHGITMYILDGKGAGQYRNVLECVGKQVKVEEPWTVMPDSSSVVSIGKFQGRMLFIGNEFRDAGTSVQLYPPNCECIVAENQSWRVESMNCGSEINYLISKSSQQPGQRDEDLRVEPSWYNQFLDNHFWEGNGWGRGISSLVVYSSGRLMDSQKPWANDLPMSRSHVIRGNHLDNNTSIYVKGSVRDVVVEGNNVQNVEQGVIVRNQSNRINVRQSNLPDGIFVRKNIFLNVDKPITTP